MIEFEFEFEFFKWDVSFTQLVLKNKNDLKP